MIHVKTYEELNIDEPQVGDYVLVKLDWLKNNTLQVIVENTPGFIYNISSENIYECKYPNDERTFRFNREQIEYWSKNKEDVESTIKAKKYNL